jgi:hypothetical protein
MSISFIAYLLRATFIGLTVLQLHEALLDSYIGERYVRYERSLGDSSVCGDVSVVEPESDRAAGDRNDETDANPPPSDTAVAIEEY